MPFQNLFICKTPDKTNNIKHRKEQDSLWANQLCHIFPIQIERASSFTSKGSITVEASLVVPLFFFAMLCLVYLLEMMAIQTTVRNALYSVGKDISQQAYLSPIISTNAIEQHMIQNIGTERLERSMIVGGADGIDCSRSSSDWNTAVIDLVVRYDLQIPVLMFRIPILSREETLRVKGWTGYVPGADESGDKDIVYITDYGVVYHRSMSCTYLEVALQKVGIEEVESLRNNSGGKYYACESCGKNSGHAETVYVTEYGNRYHTTLDCNKVKRNIYAVPLEEVRGMGGCSKCAK